MLILFVILIVLASLLLSLVVLVQNPKGGGLAGNLAGFSNQFMGVKQTTDVLEKFTWIFAGIIAVLCLLSTFFISPSATGGEDRLRKINTGTTPQQSTPNQNTVPFGTQPGTTQGPDSPR